MKQRSASRAGSRVFDALLGLIERAGNALPHPATIFLLLALATVVASAVASWVGLSAVRPGTGELITPVNLLTVEGLHRMLEKTVTNFTSFAPLGTVLVALLGIGVAEGSGLLATALRLLVLAAPRRLLTFVVVFAGILSNAASEIGYVLLIPLAGVIFLAAGRHPIAGMAAAFAGVSGGYSANLVLGTIDPLLAGLTQEAAHIVDPAYEVNPAANYYFLAVSTVLVAFLGTWVTDRIVAPRLGRYSGAEEGSGELQPLSAAEKRGLVWASVVIAAFAAVVLAGVLPEGGFLRDLKTGGILRSPLLTAIVPFIFLGGALAGVAYGLAAGTMRSDAEVMKAMGKSMETLGSYIVLVFFAAQFVAYFNWSHLGLIGAVKGAELLQASGLGGIPLMLGFVLLSAAVNLLMGSASAKWAVMAPVFVPMLMLLGYSPELTQAAYRVGDSVTNVISPTMSYFALILASVQRYDPKAGLGTLIATMLPYTLVFLLGWSLLLVAWIALGLPVGPGAGLRLAT
ncbi:MAG: AbgT family transporter [Acidobacteriota bacterium]|jgi:aminobenzoyl-glutamate transport protein